MGDIDFGPLMAFAIFGIFVAAFLAGAGAGALLMLPFALWQHNLSLMAGPSLIGGVLSTLLLGWLWYGPNRR